MSKCLIKFMDKHNLTQAHLSRILNIEPSAIHRWMSAKGTPNGKNAWKLHRYSKGEVPITEWGYVIVNGRIRRIDEQPIRLEKK